MLEFPISVSRKNDAVIQLTHRLDDKELLITNLNDVAVQVLGHHQDDIINQSFFQYIADDTASYIKEELLFEPNNNDLSYILRRLSDFMLKEKSGDVMHYSLKVFPLAVESDNIRQYEILLRDKDRKDLQDAINACCIGNIINNIPNKQAGEQMLAMVLEYIQTHHEMDVALGIMTVDELLDQSMINNQHVINDIDSIIGRRFDDCCRDEDIIFYLAPGTYIVILMGCNKDNAKIVFNRLRMRIESKPFELYNQQDLSVTVAIRFVALSGEHEMHNIIHRIQHSQQPIANSVTEFYLQYTE